MTTKTWRQQRIAKADGYDQAVAKKLKAARLAAGKSQEQAAEYLGLTFQQIQKYENGRNRCGAGRLIMLAEFYGVPRPHFLGVSPRVDIATLPALSLAGKISKLTHGHQQVLLDSLRSLEHLERTQGPRRKVG